MTDTAIDKRDDWQLKKIEIEFQTYGEHKGKYTGSIYFRNGEYESSRFNIRPDMADDYIRLISKDVVKAADQLADRLVESLGLREEEGS